MNGRPSSTRLITPHHITTHYPTILSLILLESGLGLGLGLELELGNSGS